MTGFWVGGGERSSGARYPTLCKLCKGWGTRIWGFRGEDVALWRPKSWVGVSYLVMGWVMSFRRSGVLGMRWKVGYFSPAW